MWMYVICVIIDPDRSILSVLNYINIKALIQVIPTEANTIIISNGNKLNTFLIGLSALVESCTCLLYSLICVLPPHIMADHPKLTATIHFL